MYRFLFASFLYHYIFSRYSPLSNPALISFLSFLWIVLECVVLSLEWDNMDKSKRSSSLISCVYCDMNEETLPGSLIFIMLIINTITVIMLIVL